MTPERRAEFDELCRLVGLRLMKTVRIHDWMGWEAPSSSLAYQHGTSPDAVIFEDFVLWACTSDPDARGRLSAAATEWEATSVATPAGEKFAAELAESFGLNRSSRD